jgi:DNA anti-recombination protein RmuC
MTIHWPSLAKGTTIPVATVMVLALLPRIGLAETAGILALSFITAGLVYAHDAFTITQAERLSVAVLSRMDDLNGKVDAQYQRLDRIRVFAGNALTSHKNVETLTAQSIAAVEAGLESVRKSIDSLNSNLQDMQEWLRSSIGEFQQGVEDVDKNLSAGLQGAVDAFNSSLIQIHSAVIASAEVLTKNHAESLERFDNVAETLGGEIGGQVQRALAEGRNESDRLMKSLAAQFHGLSMEITESALKSFSQTAEASLESLAVRLEEAHTGFINEINEVHKTSGEILAKLPVELKDLFGLMRGSLDEQNDAYARLIEEHTVELRNISQEQDELWRRVLDRLTDGSKMR